MPRSTDSSPVDSESCESLLLPDASRVIACRLNGSLNALSASPGGDAVVVAGRDVLKVLHIRNDVIFESVNLRVGRMNLNYSSNDVKWCPVPQYKSILATAATNGAVVVWDLERKGQQKLDRVINEHTRTVNRVAFHPKEGVLLLSGSQDGLMKLWDLRMPDGASVQTFNGKGDSVREVQFSPTHGNEFAAAFENGHVQLWDLRRPDTPERTLSAHNGMVHTIDWHPDGRYIATGGRDQFIKIWDLQSESRKPEHLMFVLAGVGRVQWRPQTNFQLGYCALTTDYRVHVLDLARAYVPLYTIEEHSSAVTGLLFRDSQTLWTVAKDRLFVQHNLVKAFEPLSQLNSTAVAWNPRGDLAVASLQRDSKGTPSAPRTFVSVVRSGLSNELRHVLNSQHPKVALSVVRTGAFDATAFVKLARNYRLSGPPLDELCSFNAEAALDANQLEVFQAWKMIGLFYGCQDRQLKSGTDGAVEKKSAPASLLRQAAVQLAARQDPPRLLQGFASSGSMDFDRDGVLDATEELAARSLAAMSAEGISGSGILFSNSSDIRRSDASLGGWPIPSPVSSSPSESSSFEELRLPIPTRRRSDSTKPLPAMANSSASGAPDLASQRATPTSERDADHVLTPVWNHAAMVRELLDFHALNGDLQTAVCILIVLRRFLDVSERVQEVWFWNYIEQLHRFQLFEEAAVVMSHSTVPAIQNVNQTSTTVYTTCARCSEPMADSREGYWACKPCRRVTNLCAFCHQPVYGLFLWCQGCGHGGHMDHMTDWFTSQVECPSGCGHRCVLTSRHGPVQAPSKPLSHP